MRKTLLEYFGSSRFSLIRRKQTASRLNYRGDCQFQIYNINNGILYEHIDVSENPVIKDRSAILKKWLKPILPDLEGRTFCVHLGDSPGNELVEGMPNLCYCKRSSDMRDLKLIPDAHYQMHLVSCAVNCIF